MNCFNPFVEAVVCYHNDSTYIFRRIMYAGPNDIRNSNKVRHSQQGSRRAVLVWGGEKKVQRKANNMVCVRSR